MMIDSMANRYGLLPSEVLTRCTTIDLYVLERSMTYRNLPRDDNGNIIKPPKQLSQAEMQAMIDSVRSI